ncbi:hypothetical protein [Haloplasma contractile]|uniref:Uncharacterized protein n=1 Tax=Haloplasma contractile SSD-17B TaxID=1033810 RepID=U2EG34_9MOLU|nr:hypothetical protein [Haloplasma contractile]ERJ13576.1 hypothetical protein HLPCO_000242 [Haloplasma contractile SSD-17B]
MNYTIPYSDKISLPRINEVLEADIVAEDINYDQTELEGKIIISGEYTVTNDSEVMEFTHEIPISFLIDDPDVNPSVDINNFTYDVIPGKGLEVNFELDVMIAEHEEPEKVEVELDDAKDKEEFQENVNSKLNEFLTDRDDEKSVVYDINEEIDPIDEPIDVEEEDDETEYNELVVDERETNEADDQQLESEEEVTEERELDQEQDEDHDDDDIEIAMSQIDNEENDNLVEEVEKTREKEHEQHVEDNDSIREDEVEIVDLEEKEVEEEEETKEIERDDIETVEKIIEHNDNTDENLEEDGRINIRPNGAISSSESYYNSLRESYSTYKVYFLDEGQSIDEFCEEHDVSRALINDEDTEETRKVVIRVDHE